MSYLDLPNAGILLFVESNTLLLTTRERNQIKTETLVPVVLLVPKSAGGKIRAFPPSLGLVEVNRNNFAN